MVGNGRKAIFDTIFLRQRHYRVLTEGHWSGECDRKFSSSGWGLNKGTMKFSLSPPLAPPSFLLFVCFLLFFLFEMVVNLLCRELVFLMIFLGFSSLQLQVVNLRVLFNVSISHDLSWSPDELSFVNTSPLPLALGRGFFIHDLASLLLTFFLNPGRIYEGLFWYNSACVQI